MNTRLSVAVIGLGYVGLSLSCLFARRHDVYGVDIDRAKADMIQRGISPIRDALIEDQLRCGPAIRLVTTSLSGLPSVDLVLVCAPTNYDPERGSFDTSAVELAVAESLERFPDATIVVKSTVPVGFINRLRNDMATDRVLHSPEFLREGRALADNLRPDRIVVGDRGPRGAAFGAVLKDLAENDPPVILTEPPSAEAAKLFANTFLAMRVAFFNEVDSFAVERGLAFSELRDAICSDSRIGDGYNEPSFGYGGYCLPKDTKQLLASFRGVPETLITAIVHSNETRKDFIVDRVLSAKPATVGVLGLAMKRGSDNFREAAVRDVASRIAARDVKVLIYEPAVESATFDGFEVVRTVEELDARSDVIICDRVRPEAAVLTKPCITRDPHLGELAEVVQ